MEVPFPVVEIDIDDNMNAAVEFGIKSVPTMLFVDENENIVDRYTGGRSKAELQAIFNKHTGAVEQ